MANRSGSSYFAPAMRDHRLSAPIERFRPIRVKFRESLMKRITLALTVACLFWGSQASAQTLEGPVPQQSLRTNAQTVPAVPSSPSWSRRASAREAIHARAAYKAAQRTQRIEAKKWFGYSPQRPPSNPMPFMSASSAWIGTPYLYYYRPGFYFPRTASRGGVQQ